MKKIKILCLYLRLVLKLISICRNWGQCSFVKLCMVDALFWKPWLKNLNCLSEMKLGDKAYSDMLNSEVMFIRCLELDVPFLGQFTAKSQKCLLKMKVRDLDYLDYAELCSMRTFPILNWKYLFWGNLVEETKTVCQRWDLLSRRIEICWIR